MRLTPEQADTIRETALLGVGARVYLFGSRVEDTARGGDVDLFVETDQAVTNRAAAASRLAARLQIARGDQRIDVVLADAHTPRQRIHETARAHGILL